MIIMSFLPYLYHLASDTAASDFVYAYSSWHQMLANFVDKMKI